MDFFSLGDLTEDIADLGELIRLVEKIIGAEFHASCAVRGYGEIRQHDDHCAGSPMSRDLGVSPPSMTFRTVEASRGNDPAVPRIPSVPNSFFID